MLYVAKDCIYSLATSSVWHQLWHPGVDLAARLAIRGRALFLSKTLRTATGRMGILGVIYLMKVFDQIVQSFWIRLVTVRLFVRIKYGRFKVVIRGYRISMAD